MESTDFQFGFTVQGSVSQPRRICRRDAVYEEALSGDGTDEGYLSLWQYPKPLVAFVREHGTVRGYLGPVYAKRLAIDIDGAGDDPIAEALEQAKRLTAYLSGTASVDMRYVQVYFSGSKGFHMELPLQGVAKGPVPDFHRIAAAFVRRLGDAAEVRLDSIYDRVRLFRLPNSRHPKTGLYKRILPAESLLELSAPRVLELALRPEPGELLDPEPGEVWCCWELESIWEDATQEVGEPQPRVPKAEKTRLNPETLDFIRHGASAGERAVRLFAAAANLAELSAGRQAIWALLEEIGLDTGLPPEEVRRQIEEGATHGENAA